MKISNKNIEKYSMTTYILSIAAKSVLKFFFLFFFFLAKEMLLKSNKR